MKQASHGEQRSHEPASSLQSGGDRTQNGRSGEGAGMQILVNQIKSCAGHRKRQEYGHSTDCGPLSVPFGEAQAADPPASPQDGKDRQDMPGEYYDRQRQMAQTDGASNQLVKDSRLKLQSEEFEV